MRALANMFDWGLRSFLAFGAFHPWVLLTRLFFRMASVAKEPIFMMACLVVVMSLMVSILRRMMLKMVGMVVIVLVMAPKRHLRKHPLPLVGGGGTYTWLMVLIEERCPDDEDDLHHNSDWTIVNDTLGDCNDDKESRIEIAFRWFQFQPFSNLPDLLCFVLLGWVGTWSDRKKSRQQLRTHPRVAQPALGWYCNAGLFSSSLLE